MKRSVLRIFLLLFSAVLLTVSAAADTPAVDTPAVDGGADNEMHTHPPADRSTWDDAESLSPGSDGSGRLSAGATTWYTFTLTDYSTVQVSADFSYSGLRFGITDEEGLEIYWENDFPENERLIRYDLPAGSYCLFFANNGYASLSYSFRLTAEATYAPPVITAHPRDTRAGADGNATFTVSATGSGLTYQWQYSTNGSRWAFCSDASPSPRLTVTAQPSFNGRQYRCMVVDSQGAYLYSDPAVLTVNPIGFVTHPVNTEASVGRTAQFTVAAMGSDLSYRWQWSADGVNWGNTSLTGYDTDTLTVTASDVVQGRRYRCVVTDRYGNTLTSSAAVLTVLPKPAITAQPTDRLASGGYVYFTVSARGNGLTYRWQYSTNGGSTWSNTALAGYDTDTLRVMASAANNGRYYRCIVTDQYGAAVTSRAARLIRGTPLTITGQPRSCTAPSGYVSFHVSAEGESLAYRWQYSTNGYSWKDTALTGCTTDTLTVGVSSITDGRQYRCVITDRYGNSVTSSAAALTMGVSITITAQPTDRTVSGGYVYFSVSAEGSGLTYRWQYSANGGKSWSNTALTGYDTDTLRVMATAGSSGRYYRCLITDANGCTVATRAARLTRT